MRGRITIRNLLGVLAPTGLYQHLPDDYPCILMYHCVGGGGYDHISPQMFDAHLRWLKREYDVVDVGSVRNPGPRKRVALTFDDGLLSFYEHVLPALERHRVPATAYLIGRTLGADRQPEDDALYMSIRQVRELARHPLVSIGSHTMTHPRLARLGNREEVRREIVDAASLLRDVTGKSVEGFCYPYNNWNDEVRQQVSETHRHAVCGMGDTELLDNAASPWSLPRINAAVNLFQLKFMVSDSWKRYNRRTE